MAKILKELSTHITEMEDSVVAYRSVAEPLESMLAESKITHATYFHFLPENIRTINWFDENLDEIEQVAQGPASFIKTSMKGNLVVAKMNVDEYYSSIQTLLLDVNSGTYKEGKYGEDIDEE